MNYQKILEYYSRQDIQEALLRVAKNREVAGVYREKKSGGQKIGGGFSERPNVLIYPSDIISMVKKGIVEFHCSMERWSNPMGLKSENYDQLRVGWDLILDLDCELTEHGKIAVQAFIWGLRNHGIKDFSIKFTGGTGFHIGIPWESMPESINFKPSAVQFPALARQICHYLKERVRENFEGLLLKKYRPQDLAQQVKKPLEAIVTDTGIDPFKIVDVDPVLISPRHLFRMPYSLNKDSFLVSLPLKPDEVGDFEKEGARPEKIKTDLGFLDSGKENEAAVLVTEAMDWYAKKKIREKEAAKEPVGYKRKIRPDLFPPCIQLISEGIGDGRKRSVFILINFLRSLRWSLQDIEKYIGDWNLKNKPPLPDTYIRSQIRYHKNKKEILPPPNCLNQAYYPNFGVCKPDHICTHGTGQITIKNPVNYPFLKMRSLKIRKAGKRKAV